MTEKLTHSEPKRRLEACFAAISRAASEGNRCPENGRFGVTSELVAQLARAGRVRVFISGKNYRVVEILDGASKGQRTAPDPSGNKPWKTIDQHGVRTNGRVVITRREAPRPSLYKITVFGT